MSVEALKRIRAKYPQYADLADEDLARRILARYPQYQDLLGDIARVAAPAPRGTYFTGGALEKVFDVLRTGEYAVGGALSRQPQESVRQAAIRGIRTREESGPQFARHLQALGAPDSFWTDAVAFGASLVLDPINLIGVGLPAKGLRAVGAARAATALEQVPARLAAPIARGATVAAEAVAPGAVAAVRGRRLLEPIIERQAIREAGGVERVMDLGAALRADAKRLTRNVKDARRLDEAVGLYFDAGADTMMNHIGRAAQITPEVMATARTAATTAQRAFLGNLDPNTRVFVQKWAPRLADEDTALAENLVRVGMMKPETAAKWKGLHLRRIYQRHEDPAAFVEFLARSDPAEAARLLGRLERGIPVTRTGAPIPTGLMKARKLLEEEVRGGLGEIRQASSRYVAGGTMAERAIARGEAFQKIAQQFAIDEDVVRGFARAPELFRQIPDTAGWGALAGKWLPKEVAAPLLQAMKRPEGLDRAIQTLVGWWKVSKVILNPATHARNIRTNVALVHNQMGLGGLNPATWTRAVREVLTNGPAFREAKATSTAFIDTFTNTEIRRFIGDLDQARGPIGMLTAPLRAVVSTMSRAYNVEEQVGKMVVYLTARGRGLSADAAGLLAEKALFNYGKVPPLVDKARRYGFYPFATFPYKVATETLPAIVRRPGRAAQQAKVLAALGTEPPEEEARALPREMRGGNFIRLPWGDARGRPLYYDLTYEYYFGDIAESGTPPAQLAKMLRGEAGGLEAVAPFLTPVGQLVAEVVLNKSLFTGQELQRKGETRARGAVRQALRTVLPGGAFALGETALAKVGLEPEPTTPLARAITGTPTRLGQVPPPVQQAALATFAGMRTVPIDVAVERRKRVMELEGVVRDIRAEMASVAQNPAYRLRPDVRAGKLEALRQRLLQVVAEYHREGAIRRP